MIAEQKRSLVMFVLMCLTIFVYYVGKGIYNALHLEPLPAFEFLFKAIFICGVGWWLRAETQSSPATRVYCTGLFASFASPILIPYHLIKTRGVRGLIPLFALIATFVIAELLAILIYLAISGVPSV
jgi:hypothetical protein